ncbi:MAG: L-threonylcarbamoyladenylate synthase [Oscillatoriales cyanobacterium C42_A2020_001]|nr:L-threonylcarbamoyladenylate synthase [Leptolyngbyaceae cyanobacterium C42_A2020_001]
MPHVSLNDLIAGVCSGDRLISFPTDTVPALASRPDRAELIFVAKQRSLDKPLILMAATVADLWQYTTGTPAVQLVWQRMAKRYLPGALTMVLPASDLVPPALNPKDPTTIGLRVPEHAIARAILSKTGPLATTSANRSGQPPLQTMPEIEAEFPDVLTLHPTELAALYASSSPTAPTLGIPSTVVRWRGDGWEVLRQGAIVLEDVL